MWFREVTPAINVRKLFIDTITEYVMTDLSIDDIPESDELLRRLKGAIKDYAHHIAENQQREFLVDEAVIDDESTNDDDLDNDLDERFEDDDDMIEENGVRFRKV